MEDRLGNAEADTAADVGGGHQSEAAMDTRRSLLKVRTHCYPIMLQLHRFMVAVSRVSVNHDDWVGARPLTPWSGIKGAGRSSARLILRLILILHRFQGRLVSCMGPGCSFIVCVTGADVAAWPQRG